MKNKFLVLFFLIIIMLPIKASAATANITLTPNIISLTTNQNLTVNISASAVGANIDVIQFSDILYNTSILELQSFSKEANCAFSFPPTNYLYSCGLSPVIGSGAVNIATVTFKTKQSGSTNITLNNLKAISAGVNVGVTGGSISINVSAPFVAPQRPGLVFVSSSTHPDENSWYSSSLLKLSWSKSVGVTGFSYLLDQNIATIPPLASLGSGTIKEYSDLKEGIYYFHIKAKNAQGWGGVRRFRINIDKTKPYDLNLSFEVGGSSIEPKTFAKFEAKDDLSGIEKFMISINGSEFVQVSSPHEMLVDEDNNSKEVVVRAYDKAGNYIEKKEKFTPKEAIVPRPEIEEISSLIRIFPKDNSSETKYFIKGKGSVKTLVSVYINDSFLGETQVDDKGDWILYFDKPKAINNRVYAISTFGGRKSEKSDIVVFSFDRRGFLVIGESSNIKPLTYMLLLIVLLIGIVVMYKKRFKKFLHIKKIQQSN